MSHGNAPPGTNWPNRWTSRVDIINIRWDKIFCGETDHLIRTVQLSKRCAMLQITLQLYYYLHTRTTHCTTQQITLITTQMRLTSNIEALTLTN